jgi:WD40 repeat protein
MKIRPSAGRLVERRSQAAIFLVVGLVVTAANSASAAHELAAFELPGNTYRIGAVAFSQDLKWLAAWRVPDQVEVWDLAKGSKAASWTAGPAAKWALLPSGHGRPLALLEDGKILVATATNVAVRDLLSGKTEQTLEDSGPDLGQITVSPDGGCVAGVNPNGEFEFWSLPDGGRLTHLPTKRAPWEPRSSPFNYNSMAMRTTPASMSPGTGWAFSSDGNLFAIGRLFAVDLWDFKAGKWLSRFSGMSVPEFRIGAATFTGTTTVAFLSSSNLAVVCGGALAVLSVGTDLSALAVTNPAGTPKERLEIRALAVSADGQRLALAGMRMASRPSAGDPGAGGVFDVPQHGEIQVWNVVPLRLFTTIQGKADEKFGSVALEAAGKRVAAVTTGVRYTAKMTNSAQQSAELSPPGPYRVTTWDVP